MNVLKKRLRQTTSLRNQKIIKKQLYNVLGPLGLYETVEQEKYDKVFTNTRLGLSGARPLEAGRVG